MSAVLGIRRAGWWMLLVFFVLPVSAGGCGSGGEAVAPSLDASGTTVEDPVSGVDAWEPVDTAAFTEAFLPEITVDDIEALEGDGGMSYRYVFPTRELSGGVVFDLEARWDPVDGGLQPSLMWNLTGDETSPSDFVFVASMPKSFAETVDDIVFDPEPTRIINPDVVAEWLADLLVSSEVHFTATSKTIVGSDEAVDVIGSILAHANAIRLHSELSVCSEWTHHLPSMAACFLAVVADNPGYFTPDSCDVLGVTVRQLSIYPEWGTIFSAACTTVVGRIRYGTPISCDSVSGADREGCLKLMWGVLSGACNGLDRLDQQICVYEAAAALGDEARCVSLENLGNPEMANDCRAAITKDPSWCAKTEDPKLRASCCENFRGTDAYDTCLASVGADVTEEGTTATTSIDETVADEPGEEDLGLAIPAGIYTGSFDVQPLTSHFFLESAVTHLNTITIAIDGSGSISGDFTAYQTGLQAGCPGAEERLVGTIDAGQTIGPDLPQKVTVTQERSGVFSLGFSSEDGECAAEPDIWAEEGPNVLVLEGIQDGVLTGTLGIYLPFALE